MSLHSSLAKVCHGLFCSWKATCLVWPYEKLVRCKMCDLLWIQFVPAIFKWCRRLKSRYEPYTFITIFKSFLCLSLQMGDVVITLLICSVFFIKPRSVFIVKPSCIKTLQLSNICVLSVGKSELFPVYSIHWGLAVLDKECVELSFCNGI